MKKYIQLFGLCLFLVGACSAPMPVLRQSPFEEKGTWYQGLEYVMVNGQEAQMAIAFSGIDNGDMIYDVEIENLSQESYLVDPANFFGVALPFQASSLFWEGKEGAIQPEHEIFAYDPEEVLLNFDKGIARVDAARRNRNTASIIAGLAAVGAAVAVAASSGSDGGGGEAVADNSFIWIENGDNQNEEAHLMQSKAYWESAVLRKTTLAPGQKVRGLVYFSANPDARFNYLYFPLGNETLRITFQQKRIDPRDRKINGLEY